MKNVTARLAGHEIVAVSHAGNASKVKLGPAFLAGRTAQAVQPHRNVRIGLVDRFGRSAHLKAVVTIHTPRCVKIRGVAWIASRVHPKLGLLADGA